MSIVFFFLSIGRCFFCVTKKSVHLHWISLLNCAIKCLLIYVYIKNISINRMNFSFTTKKKSNDFFLKKKMASINERSFNFLWETIAKHSKGLDNKQTVSKTKHLSYHQYTKGAHIYRIVCTNTCVLLIENCFGEWRLLWRKET